MKWLYLLPLFLMTLFIQKPIKDEDPITLCGSMKQWADDPAFQAAHLNPLPYTGQQFIGEKIEFPTPDGQKGYGYLIKAKKKSDKYLFVYQEWWGLNEYIKAESDKFYKDLNEEVNVIAVDLYDGKVAADAQEAGKLMGGVDENRLNNIVKGAMNYAGAKAKIANVGWCFGGSWSLKSALLLGKQNVGSVMYYGMPVRDVAQLKTLHSDVLSLFATEQWISKEVIEDFDAKMKEAGKKLAYRIFPGKHAFANPSNPAYDKENAEVAYGMALDYLKARLKVK